MCFIANETTCSQFVEYLWTRDIYHELTVCKNTRKCVCSALGVHRSGHVRLVSTGYYIVARLYERIDLRYLSNAKIRIIIIVLVFIKTIR